MNSHTHSQGQRTPRDGGCKKKTHGSKASRIRSMPTEQRTVLASKANVGLFKIKKPPSAGQGNGPYRTVSGSGPSGKIFLIGMPSSRAPTLTPLENTAVIWRREERGETSSFPTARSQPRRSRAVPFDTNSTTLSSAIFEQEGDDWQKKRHFRL